MKMKTALKFVLGLSLLAAASLPAMSAGEKAKAVLMPTKDSKTTGWAWFANNGNQLRVWGQISGLTPGKHGFHVHEFGDCSAPDATSAGSHLSMTGQKHAAPANKMRHSGDFGNLEADANGVAKFDFSIPMSHGLHSVLGRGLIVHAKADDLKTQPTGDAGGRLACGIIGMAK